MTGVEGQHDVHGLARAVGVVYDSACAAVQVDQAVDSLERSFDAAGQGATAFNRKLIDIAQRNLNSGFDLAKSLAGAKNLAEIVELQSAFIRHQFDVFANQASEIRALTTKIAADTAEPIKAQVTRSFETIRKST